MRERIGQIGDPTSGMWRRKAALASRFETLGLEPAEPDSFDDSSWPTRPTAPARSGRRGAWGA
jgi:hypothetical protein